MPTGQLSFGKICEVLSGLGLLLLISSWQLLLEVEPPAFLFNEPDDPVAPDALEPDGPAPPDEFVDKTDLNTGPKVLEVKLGMTSSPEL